MGRYGDPAHYVPVKNKRGGDFRRGYPLSWELRLEIIKLHLQGISHRQIANRTKRARATVGRICTKYDLTNRFAKPVLDNVWKSTFAMAASGCWCRVAMAQNVTTKK